jgi:hypothetical protein
MWVPGLAHQHICGHNEGLRMCVHLGVTARYNDSWEGPHAVFSWDLEHWGDMSLEMSVLQSGVRARNNGGSPEQGEKVVKSLRSGCT